MSILPVHKAAIGDTLAARRYGGQSQMAAPTVRRADFLMALAYATDLATGHSRDFALRSCVLAMRFAEVAKLDDQMSPSIFHPAAVALHRLQCRHAPAVRGVGPRNPP